MKRVLVASALLAAVSTPAAAATIIWQGDLFITAVNNATACAAVNLKVGDFARFSYRPKNVAGSTNGTFDQLGWQFARAAGHLTVPSSTNLDQATQAVAVRSINEDANFAQIMTPIDGMVDPAGQITPDDTTVLVTLTINNIHSRSPGSLSGCHPTFSGALTKRPNGTPVS
jgi:hypothetical protein